MSAQVPMGESISGKRSSSQEEKPSSSDNARSPPVHQDKEEKRKKAKAGFTSRLPDWITTNATNRRSLKVFFRCTLVSWSSLVLFLPHSSLNVLGQAAFLGLLTTFLIPAAMPLWIYVMASGIQIFGILLAWAWSSAAMAASLRARSQVLLSEQERKVQASVGGNTNPEAVYEAAIFRGEFLDTASTTVYGIFLVFAAWSIGVIQIKFPKLKIGTIFFLILADIMCSYGPLFPFAEYTLGEVVLYPVLCATAIALAAEFLIFPETLNTAWQLNLIKMLGLARKTIGVHQTAMHRMMDEEQPYVVEAELDPTIRRLHSGIIALATGLGAQRGFLELEITYSRLSGKDLSSIYIEIRTMIVRLFGLNAFFHLMEQEASATEISDSKGPLSLHDSHAVSRCLSIGKEWAVLTRSPTDLKMEATSLQVRDRQPHHYQGTTASTSGSNEKTTQGGR